MNLLDTQRVISTSVWDSVGPARSAAHFEIRKYYNIWYTCPSLRCIFKLMLELCSTHVWNALWCLSMRFAGTLAVLLYLLVQPQISI